VFGRMAANVFEHLGQDAAQLLGWPVAIAALVGLVLGARGGQLRRVWPVLVAAALIFLTLVPVFYSERYSLALLPAYALLAALAFATPFGALAIGAGHKTWLKPFLAVVPLGLSLVASARMQARVIDQLPVEVLECAETLRAARAPGDRVIARKGHIAYHGGVEAVGFPFVNGLDTLASYARQAKARWLYFSWPEAETRPQYSYLLDTSAVVPGLTPRRVTEPHPAVLYEIGPDFGRVPAWLSNDTLRAWHDTYAALLIDGTDAKLLARLGALSYQLGRLTQARDALYQAAKLAPDRPEVFLLLGRTLIELGDASAAEATFARAEILDPTSAEARIGRGLAADIQGRSAEAAQLWRPVIAATPNPRILERMIELYQSLGDAAAADVARRALSRVRGDAGGRP
jgi:tetratricopeptide (TPR) repeat protein